MKSIDSITLSVLGRGVAIQCRDEETRAVMIGAYGQLSGQPRTIDLNYTVGRHGISFLISRESVEPFVARSWGEFLAAFDGDLSIELQKLRRDLYFVHAAVVEFAGQGLMLAAKSGSGKSTTTWALLHHGFRYSSDELGPVDLDTLEVYPFPRALSLKKAPPAPFGLSEPGVGDSERYYLRTSHFPAGHTNQPTPLAAIFFLRYSPEAAAPSIRRISEAEGAARLYADSLNPLAHPANGLEGAIRIASKRACFELLTSDLTATCALITETVKGLTGPHTASSRTRLKGLRWGASRPAVTSVTRDVTRERDRRARSQPIATFEL